MAAGRLVMMDLVYFLGRFHVLVLHLPIGVLLLAAGLEVLRRHPRFSGLETALPVIWLAGAVTALLTIVLGYMHAAEGGFDRRAIDLHRWSATALALFAFAVWACRTEARRAYARAWPVAVAGTLVLLILTGHYGGALTHGTTYLAEYAPGPLRGLLGGAGEAAPRPPVTALAEADLYLDVVAPALRRRCGSCHNEARRRGDLSMASHAALMEGGETGPALIPGDPDASDLVRRVRLPEADVDFMPKNGKPPLTPDEIEAVAWWVAAGRGLRRALRWARPPRPTGAASGYPRRTSCGCS